MKSFLLCAAALLGVAMQAISPSVGVADVDLRIAVPAAKHHRAQFPMRVQVELPKELAETGTAELIDEKGRAIIGQFTGPSLLDPVDKSDKDTVTRSLWFIVPALEAEQPLRLSGKITNDQPTVDPAGSFTWKETPGEYIQLSLGGLPVLRYMHQPLDESTPAQRELTYKVFHHLFDPTGQTVLTKGAGSLYTHHRGLFYGFNKISYGDGKTADTWHCTNDAHLSHEGVLASEAGPVLGRQRLSIAWHGPGKEVFAHEERELTVYNVPGARLVEFASRLRTDVGPIKLDGDPQHAGFQFRASAEVAESTKEQTYYLRPDGRGQPGQFRNWPEHKEHVNLPWNGMSFVVGGQRYTALYLDRPENPKESRFSERDYGRFGSYFAYDLTEDKPLDLNYQVWVQPGELTVEEAADHAADFVARPNAEVH
ncbi:MAG: DUF6807 family protein [Pirellulales bacterium]